MTSSRQGQLAGLAAAVLFGCSEPLISPFTGSALCDLGAAREAVLFSTAPFVGALFSLVVLRDSPSTPLLLAAGLMAAGVAVLLRGQHSYLHRHRELEQARPHVSDAHHRLPH
ncbi:MAG: hypothetical protein ACKOPT_11980 [Cyanobium sp.]